MSRRWSEPILWKTKFGTIFGLCVLPYVILAATLNWYFLGVQGDSKNWPSVIGTIVLSERGDGILSKRSRHFVEYTYAVEGKEYTGTRVRAQASNVWPFGGNRFSADSPFPVGSSVSVWYDPTNPARCVLQRGSDWSDSLWAWVVTAFCLIMLEPWWLWDRIMYGKDHGDEDGV